MSSVTSKLHPSLYQRDDDGGGRTSSTTQLVIQYESTGIEIGPLAQLEKLCQVMELTSMSLWLCTHIR